MANPQEKKTEPPYEIRGVPVHAYVTESGEFRWIPTAQACSDRSNAERILEVLRKMPDDRRAVWASRLDLEQTKKSCPVIRDELCSDFDEFIASYTGRLNRKQGR